MLRWTPKGVKSSCNGFRSPEIWNDSGRYPTRQYFLHNFAVGGEALAPFAGCDIDEAG
jgi:hypothetical protein